MTSEEAKQVMAVVIAVGDAIKEMGAQGAPEGPMYQAFMERGLSLHSFNMILGHLESIKVIRRSNHVAYWIG